MTTARKLMLLLLALDCFSVLAVFNTVSRLRGITLESHEIIFLPLLVPLLLLLFALYLIDGYKPRTDMMSLDYTSQHVIAIVSGMLATLLLTFAVIPAPYSLQSSRIVVSLSFLILAPISLGYRRAIYGHLAQRHDTRCLVFLGDHASCLTFREECRRAEMKQPIIFTVVTEESASPFASGADLVLRPFRAVINDVQSGKLSVEAIVLRESNRDLQPEVSQQLMTLYFAGVPTYTLELFHQIYWQKIPLYRLNQTWLFQEGFQIAREPVFERLKRTSDIFLSIVGLVLASPLIAVAGIGIWLEDRGSIFFRQRRVGKNHRAFNLVKLRTMRLNVNGDRYTQPGDHRITRIGRFLRASRIDEFPQLWNVLLGEMSLIGPRAEWDKLVEEYERQIPCYYFRHLVKPGITGWAQVNYPYGASIEDTLRKLEYDLYYIRHFSFTLDASIVLKTIHIMLFGKGR